MDPIRSKVLFKKKKKDKKGLRLMKKGGNWIENQRENLYKTLINC